VLVGSDRPAAPGLAAAAALGLDTVALPPEPDEGRAAYGERLRAAIDAQQPDIVALAGFMRILDASFVQAYGDGCSTCTHRCCPVTRGCGRTSARSTPATCTTAQPCTT
jgi:phosphoribosylglycinamide formyltransferase-1